MYVTDGLDFNLGTISYNLYGFDMLLNFLYPQSPYVNWRINLSQK